MSADAAGNIKTEGVITPQQTEALKRISAKYGLSPDIVSTTIDGKHSWSDSISGGNVIGFHPSIMDSPASQANTSNLNESLKKLEASRNSANAPAGDGPLDRMWKANVPAETTGLLNSIVMLPDKTETNPRARQIDEMAASAERERQQRYRRNRLSYDVEGAKNALARDPNNRNLQIRYNDLVS